VYNEEVKLYERKNEMNLITSLKLSLQVRREHRRIAIASERRMIEQKAVYRYMDELSAQGYDFINPPKV
jgi:hypothetical protein